MSVPEEMKRGSETVLVAEDDGVLRKLIRTTLEYSGYAVIEAVDGDDAIRKFQENKEKISLFLCDVIMPKKSGAEAGEAIKKISPELKIVFMSGYPADIIRQKGLLDEKAEIILKPVSPIALLGKIREVLDR
jgi:two-component system cell cycle sensor histidine kinase/response regulator CckA